MIRGSFGSVVTVTVVILNDYDYEGDTVLSSKILNDRHL